MDCESKSLQIGEGVMKLGFIVGARPNFMKVAPILRCLNCHSSVESLLIHTGQHYDEQLSEVFFRELAIRSPDVFFSVGSGTHAAQTSAVMTAVESLLLEHAAEGSPFHHLVVVGDVNSTMAATVAAAKCGVSVAHVEAGLRSGDRTMPEEINRLITDSVSDILLCSEESGRENLLREGHREESVHLVGNVMIDTLMHQLKAAKDSIIHSQLSLVKGEYGVVTLHRPSNVDCPQTLESLVDVIVDVSDDLPLVFPIHPRTESKLKEYGLRSRLEQAGALRLLGPLGYQDFLCLTSQAKVIVTDSGGLQEESTALGIPCLTMRENTERPITVELGTSTLVGSSAELLEEKLREVITGGYKQGSCPSLWDGRAAERIVDVLLDASEVPVSHVG